MRDLPRIALAALVTAAFLLPGAEAGAASIAGSLPGTQATGRIAERDASAAFAAAVEAGADPELRRSTLATGTRRGTI